MTYEQALDRATKLHADGKSFEDIAEALKKAKYASPHSGRPVGAQAVRAMLRRAKGASKDSPQGGRKGPQEASEVLADIAALSQAPGLSEERRLGLIRLRLDQASQAGQTH